MSAQTYAPSPYAFPLKPREYAAAPLPSMSDWQTLWTAWDLVTTKMIPAEALMEQPIALRNPLLFYLGHIPTFEDIHLTRATKAKATEPKIYHTYFERGIDPDVNNPTRCHDHSELPQEWPTVQNILNYREKVKARIIQLYESPDATTNRTIQRAIWIGFEHECLHLETFLYMTLQSPNVLPPPGPKPDFAGIAERAHSERVENQWFRIPTQTIAIGFEDPESDDGPDRYFAWDNERGPYTAHVPGIECQARPVCNEEYAKFIFATCQKNLPATWTENPKSSQTAENCDSFDDFVATQAIRTVYGPVPLSLALDWPLMASFNEVQSYATWAGARIPSLLEVRSIHEHVEKGKRSQNPDDSTKSKQGPNPEEMFVDLTGCNVGLQHFHPMPVTQNGGRISGLGDMGGAWEWTSTLLAPQPNFKPMDIYPGYSADFMDGKHIAITGGSWALPPRIAGRKCFLNWWQPNYLYPWVAVRLVRDIVQE